MTGFLLDTNVVSEIAKLEPDAAISEWIASQPAAGLFIATLTVAEIRRGILELPAGRRRAALEGWFGGPEGPQSLFRDRILSFDIAAALHWGRLIAEGRARGRSRSALDMIIAATALANECVVVTLNERHFAGVAEFFNPRRRTVMC